MKYPRLKCEDKLNTVVCSLTIKKMKEMRKNGFTYKKIADSLKIGPEVVRYHISPTFNTPESIEKRKKYGREYIKRRYNTDPEYRRKMLDSIRKHHKEKLNTDPKFKEYYKQLQNSINPIWNKKQQEKHPNWSYTCARGVHETITIRGCKNQSGNCKCPCHKRLLGGSYKWLMK